MQFISLALRDERLDPELCSTMIVLAQFRLDVCFPGVSQTPSSQAHTSWMTFCCLPLGSLHGSALRHLPSSQSPLLTPTLAPFSVSQATPVLLSETCFCLCLAHSFLGSLKPALSSHLCLCKRLTSSDAPPLTLSRWATHSITASRCHFLASVPVMALLYDDLVCVCRFVNFSASFL